MPGIDYTIGAKTSGFSSGIDGALGKLAGLGKAVAGMTALAGGAALAGIGAGIAKAVGKAADMEGLKTAFIPLLAGIDAAEKRLSELTQFAAATPFELPEVANASKTLETLTKGALSTGNGLTLVGDVASATNQPFDEMAVTIGRLYDGLDSGRPVGEAMARLQELGIISGASRAKLEAMQAEGKKGPEVWAVAKASMEKFSGSMKLQSETWNGKLSNLTDNIGQALAAFGAPIMDSLKPFLDDAIGMTGSLTEVAAKFGGKVADAIGYVRAAFTSGNIAEAAGLALKIGFQEGVNFLWKSFTGILNAVGQYFVELGRNFVTMFEILTTPDFWKGLGNALMGVLLDCMGFLQSGLAKALEVVRPIAELFGKGDAINGAQGQLRENANTWHGMADDKYGKAGDQIGPSADKAIARLKEAGENIVTAYANGFEKTANLFDTGDGKARLRNLHEDWMASAETEKAARKKAANDLAADVVKPKTGEDAAAAVSKGGSKGISADRLAQIGGYVGKSAASMASKAAEKTEQWTRKTAEGVASLVKNFRSGMEGRPVTF